MYLCLYLHVCVHMSDTYVIILHVPHKKLKTQPERRGPMAHALWERMSEYTLHTNAHKTHTLHTCVSRGVNESGQVGFRSSHIILLFFLSDSNPIRLNSVQNFLIHVRPDPYKIIKYLLNIFI
jgi:hypothetical protein